MPTYEYACKSCGHTFEIVQSMKDDSLTVCPECSGELRKVFGAPAISFKGSGFYATDHGKKSKKTSEPAKPAEGAKAAEKKSDGSGDSGSKPTESKPAASSPSSSPSAEAKPSAKKEPGS
jgi:putative FmdB family regulatory protein